MRAAIAEIQRAGRTTLAAIAQELEARGVRTPAGHGRWAPAQVAPGCCSTELLGLLAASWPFGSEASAM